MNIKIGYITVRESEMTPGVILLQGTQATETLDWREARQLGFTLIGLTEERSRQEHGSAGVIAAPSIPRGRLYGPGGKVVGDVRDFTLEPNDPGLGRNGPPGGPLGVPSAKPREPREGNQ
jgi:hypothetical protein